MDDTQAVDVRAVGERIERLLDAAGASGPVVRERAEELLRLVVELYGTGLERVLEIAYDAGALNDDVLDALAGDELVASLMLVHGLHPYSVAERISRALDKVRPYLGTHGGDVELVEVTDQGIVKLRLLGSCDGCASSAVTLDLAVRDAIEAAAPEVVGIDVVDDAPVATPTPGLIPIDALTARLRHEELGGSPSWVSIGATADLPESSLWSVRAGDRDIVVARIGPSLFAYRDCCAACGSSLALATVERRLGHAGEVLTCPRCRAHFDIRRAGAGIDDVTIHLDPLPLLERDGVIEVAVPSPIVSGATV